MLQNALNVHIPHTAGLNPKAYRSVSMCTYLCSCFAAVMFKDKFSLAFVFAQCKYNLMRVNFTIFQTSSHWAEAAAERSQKHPGRRPALALPLSQLVRAQWTRQTYWDVQRSGALCLFYASGWSRIFRGGEASKKGCKPIILAIFPWKLHQIEKRNGPRVGRVSLAVLVDPPLIAANFWRLVV